MAREWWRNWLVDVAASLERHHCHTYHWEKAPENFAVIVHGQRPYIVADCPHCGTRRFLDPRMFGMKLEISADGQSWRGLPGYEDARCEAI